MVATQLERRIMGQASELTTLRHTFGDWLERSGVEDVELDDWALVFSELVANACAYSPHGSEVSIRATCADRRLTLRVSNRMGERSQPPIPRAVDPLAVRGRGLMIVNHLVDSLIFEADGSEITATCWRRTTACDDAPP